MLFYSSQTIGFQHLLKPSFLNTDFEGKQDSSFPYMPYMTAISFPNANNLILAFVLLNFLKKTDHSHMNMISYLISLKCIQEIQICGVWNPSV